MDRPPKHYEIPLKHGLKTLTQLQLLLSYLHRQIQHGNLDSENADYYQLQQAGSSIEKGINPSEVICKKLHPDSIRVIAAWVTAFSNNRDLVPKGEFEFILPKSETRFNLPLVVGNDLNYLIESFYSYRNENIRDPFMRVLQIIHNLRGYDRNRFCIADLEHELCGDRNSELSHDRWVGYVFGDFIIQRLEYLSTNSNIQITIESNINDENRAKNFITFCAVIEQLLQKRRQSFNKTSGYR
jgi:hypothetical protein